MLVLSLNELKAVPKIRGIKSYKRMAEERWLRALNESEPVKESKMNFDDARIKRSKKILMN